MQILGLEYKYLAVWICKCTEEDFTSKRMTWNSCVVLIFFLFYFGDGLSLIIIIIIITIIIIIIIILIIIIYHIYAA